MKKGFFLFKLIKSSFAISLFFVVTVPSISIAANDHDADPLPSWNEGPNKTAIFNFIEEVTAQNSPNFVPVEDRIATFDLDGTLLVEKPLPAQGQFLLEQSRNFLLSPLKAASSIVQSILSLDFKDLYKMNEMEITNLLSKLYQGLSYTEYQSDIKNWLQTSVHSEISQPFGDLFYQPMVEVIKLLQDHEFSVFIVSGSGHEFIRVLADVYQIVPKNCVIGTTVKTKYENKKNKPSLFLTGQVLRENNHGGKVEGIQLHIGKKPIAVFGNSDGDKEMIEWAQSEEGAKLLVLVHHDDEKREYAYDQNAHMGKLSKKTMQIANERGWLTVSMKDDWNKVFITKHI